jgi:hypothetical protein
MPAERSSTSRIDLRYTAGNRVGIPPRERIRIPCLPGSSLFRNGSSAWTAARVPDLSDEYHSPAASDGRGPDPEDVPRQDPSAHDARVPVLAVRPVTFPVAPGIIEVSIRRHLERSTSLVDYPIPSIATPPWPVRSVRQVPVRWDLNGGATVLVSSVPPVAVPAGPRRITGQVSVGRHLDGDALPLVNSVPPVAVPSGSR